MFYLKTIVTYPERIITESIDFTDLINWNLHEIALYVGL